MKSESGETSFPICPVCKKEIPFHKMEKKTVACVELFYHKHCVRTGQRCILAGWNSSTGEEKTLYDWERRELNTKLFLASSCYRWMVKA